MMPVSDSSEAGPPADKKTRKGNEDEGRFLKARPPDDEDEGKDLEDTDTQCVVNITSNETSKDDEERKKGILKHARTYSNKHVDFNLDVEFVPFDETKDFTIEIQIVEQMPKKVISYAALFAEQKAQEEAEKLKKEKQKIKNATKRTKSKESKLDSSTSSGNVNYPPKDPKCTDNIEEKIEEDSVESNKKRKGKSNEDSQDEICVGIEGERKEEIIIKSNKEKEAETKEKNDAEISKDNISESSTKDVAMILDEMDKTSENNPVEINKNIDETANMIKAKINESVDETSEKIEAKNNENVLKSIEESSSLETERKTSESTMVKDNNTMEKGFSKTIPVLLMEEQSAPEDHSKESENSLYVVGKEPTPLKLLLEIPRNEEKELSDDEYQDALSNSDDFNNSEFNNNDKNIHHKTLNEAENILCSTNDEEKGDENDILEFPNENGEESHYSDISFEESISVSQDLSSSSSNANLDRENLEEDSCKQETESSNKKHGECLTAPTLETEGIENVYEEVAIIQTNSSCNKQGIKDECKFLSEIVNIEEFTATSIGFKGQEIIGLIPSNEKHEHSSEMNAPCQPQIECMSPHSLLESVEINNNQHISVQSPHNSSTDVSPQEISSLINQQSLSLGNEDSTNSEYDEKVFEQIKTKALFHSESPSENNLHHEETVPKEGTIHKNLISNKNPSEPELINKESSLSSMVEKHVEESEYNNYSETNELISKIKNVCEIDNQRVTERLSELP